MTVDELKLRVSAVLFSCPERAETRRQTLGSLARTDWGKWPVHVEVDAKPTPDRLENISHTARVALAHGVETGAHYVLFLEDDLEFNHHLCHNLASWTPLRCDAVTLASLYNPGVQSVFSDPEHHYFEAHPHHVYGSQALLFSRATAQYVLAHWPEVAALPDIRVSRLAARLQKPLYYHVPSLVQHVGQRSVWGGKFHQAADFDPAWRADVTPDHGASEP